MNTLIIIYLILSSIMLNAILIPALIKVVKTIKRRKKEPKIKYIEAVDGLCYVTYEYFARDVIPNCNITKADSGYRIKHDGIGLGKQDIILFYSGIKKVSYFTENEKAS